MVVLYAQEVPLQGFLQCPRQICHGEFSATLRLKFYEANARVDDPAGMLPKLYSPKTSRSVDLTDLIRCGIDTEK